MKDLDWNLLKSFVFVVNKGSLSAAARELKTTQPTVGRHIEALEIELGMSLFTRSREGFSPTEEALDLIPDIEAMLGHFSSFTRKIEGEKDEGVGTVRLAASEVMGVEVLPNILKRFNKNYPGIKIELTLSNKNENLLKRDADLAIRMARPLQEALVAKKLGDIPLHLYAHKSYLKSKGVPRRSEDLKQHTLIGPDRDQEFLKTLGHLGIALNRDDLNFRLDNQIAQIELLRRGLGIGIMQKPLAIKDKNLVPIMPRKINIPLPTWIVMHEDLRASKKVRLIFNYLVSELQQYILINKGTVMDNP